MSTVDTKNKNINFNIDLDVDVENELLLVSNCIQNNENRNIILRNLSYKDFRHLDTQVLIWSLNELHNKKLEVNTDSILLYTKYCPISVSKNITFSYIEKLVTNYPYVSKENCEEHVNKVKTDKVKAKLIELTYKSLLKDCLTPQTDLSRLMTNVDFLKREIETGYSASRLEFKDMAEVVANYEEEKDKEIDKRTTGYRQLDEKITEGFKEGQITTVAALPSMGKSSLVLSMMLNLSNKNVHAAQFALEMNNISLMHKLLAYNTQMPVSSIIRNTNKFNEHELKLYKYELDRLRRNKYIYLNDTPGQTLSSIRTQCMMLQDHLKEQYIVVAIDLFGKIRDFQSSDNFARDYEKKLNEAQIMVRELGVHMILVAQINRTVAKRSFSRPTMHDLKNAGALEEVSDLILGVHRPFYNPEIALKAKLLHNNTGDYSDDIDELDELDQDPRQNLAEVLILKQRMGENNDLVNFYFDPVTTRFQPIDPNDQALINTAKSDLSESTNDFFGDM